MTLDSNKMAKRVLPAVALVVAVGMAALVGTHYAKADYNDPASSSGESSESSSESSLENSALSSAGGSSGESTSQTEGQQATDYGIVANASEDVTITGQLLNSKGAFFYEAGKDKFGNKLDNINIESSDIKKVNAAVNALNDKLDGTTTGMNTALSNALAREVAERTSALSNLENATNTRLTAEEQARTSAIAAETQARTSAMAAETQARTDAMNAETQARTSAMTDLESRTSASLAAEQQARTDFENRTSASLSAASEANTTAVTNLQNDMNTRFGNVDKTIGELDIVRYEYENIPGNPTITFSPKQASTTDP